VYKSAMAGSGGGAAGGLPAFNPLAALGGGGGGGQTPARPPALERPTPAGHREPLASRCHSWPAMA